jgi:hypothetical protein
MSYELTKEEKIVIINQHIKNLEYNIYNLEISLIEEAAVPSQDADRISSLNDELSQINFKKTALLAELSELTA